jgi:uncharacterized membrane protein
MDDNQTEAASKPAVVEQTESRNTSPSSFVFNEQSIMAAIAYLGILVLIPLFVKKEDPFVAFHIKQGLVLLVPSVLIYILGHTMHSYVLWKLFDIINIAIICLSILGIINALKLKLTTLPLVGSFAKHIKI